MYFRTSLLKVVFYQGKFIMNNIYTICFDGLHNNGKGTQISLLSKQLKDLGVSVLIRRGDGMRKGVGSEPADPFSIWWQENIARMRATGFEGPESMSAATEASNRLNAEISVAKNYFMPHLMKEEGTSTGVILLDRGPISRLFVKRRENPESDFNSIKHFNNCSGRHEIIMPDKIFLLHAPLSVLISRNSDRTSEKSKFNETVLTKYYSDFENVINDLPPEIAQRTLQVDSSTSIEDVNKVVVSQLKEMNIFASIEGQNVHGAERR